MVAGPQDRASRIRANRTRVNPASRSRTATRAAIRAGAIRIAISRTGTSSDAVPTAIANRDLPRKVVKAARRTTPRIRVRRTDPGPKVDRRLRTVSKTAAENVARISRVSRIVPVRAATGIAAVAEAVAAPTGKVVRPRIRTRRRGRLAKVASRASVALVPSGRNRRDPHRVASPAAIVNRVRRETALRAPKGIAAHVPKGIADLVKAGADPSRAVATAIVAVAGGVDVVVLAAARAAGRTVAVRMAAARAAVPKVGALVRLEARAALVRVPAAPGPVVPVRNSPRS